MEIPNTRIPTDHSRTTDTQPKFRLNQCFQATRRASREPLSMSRNRQITDNASKRLAALHKKGLQTEALFYISNNLFFNLKLSLLAETDCSPAIFCNLSNISKALLFSLRLKHRNILHVKTAHNKKSTCKLGSLIRNCTLGCTT